MMRTFAVVAAEDHTRLLDLIMIDEDTGEIAFGSGAAEDLFDEIAPLDDGLDVDQVIAALDSWVSDHLVIGELDDDTGSDLDGSAIRLGPPADQIASLTGAARQRFNDLHDRGFGGKFARKGSGNARNAPQGASAARVLKQGAERAASAAAEHAKAAEQRRKELQHWARGNEPIGVDHVSRGQLLATLPDRNAHIIKGENGKFQALDDTTDELLFEAPTRKALYEKISKHYGGRVEEVREDAGDRKTMFGQEGDRANSPAMKAAAPAAAPAPAAKAAGPSAPEKPPVHRAPRGAVDKAIATGQPDALADIKRPALLAAVKKRNLIISSGMSDDDLRSLLLDNANVPAPKTPKTVAAALKAGDRDALAGMSKASLVAAVKKQGGLGLGNPSKLDQGELADALLDARPEQLSPPQMVKKLQGAKSRDEAATMLEGKTVTELRKLADEMKMPYNKNAPKKRMHDDVINWAVGHDLDSKAIRGEHNTLFAKPDLTTPRETLESRALREQAKALGIDVSELGHDREALAKRILEVHEANKRPDTSKMNAHSIGVGDRILEGGETLKVVGTRQDIENGQPVVHLTVTDKDGRQKKIVKALNAPLDRLRGGRGGAGTFAAETFAAELPDFAALDGDALFAWLADLSSDQVAALAPLNLSGDQVAAYGGVSREEFDRLHPRGRGGLFGHSNKLFDMLRAKSDSAGAREGDHGLYFTGAGKGYEKVDSHEFFQRSFDWSNRNPDPLRRGGQEHLFDITGPTATRVDDEEDEDGNVSEDIIDADEVTARIRMSDGDLRNLSNMIGTLLLRKQLTDGGLPFEPDDPRTPYIIAMMDLQDRNMWQPEDSNYDDNIHIYRSDGDSWHFAATDDEGTDVSFYMSQAELEALYGQLTAYLLTPAGRESPPAQTAALEWQQAELDYADDFATWAANEFDISTMPERLQRYWTEGPGAAKVKWGVRGAFKRCTRNLTKEGVPLHMVKGACANLYRRATGKYPGRHSRRNRTGPGRMNVMGSRIALPMQTACAACGNDQMMVDLGADYGPGDMPDLEQPSTSVGWRGPLAPIDVKTGDRRQFALDALKTRRLPLPFRWQERQQPGHDGAVVVGALTGYSVADDGTIMGEGYFLDPEVIPEVEKARYLVEHGLVGPSVDLEPDMDVEFADSDGNTFDPHECQADGTCPAKPRAVITDATVTGATLVPITAFAEVRAPQLFDRTVADDMALTGAARSSCGCGQQVAAVRANGWDDLPFADREREWDKGAAVARLVDWATGEDGELDLGRYGQAFLWHDEPADTQGAFKLPIADIDGDQLTIIPRAVFAVAARLNQTDIPASAKQDVRDVLEDLYDQMSDEFDDEDMQAPWEQDSGAASGTGNEMAAAETSGCGCADKWARALAPAGAQTAAAVFAGMDPYPADAFKVKADRLTPMTIDDRPDEPFTRFYGHIGSWSSCNRGHRGVCVPPPRSRSGYKEFHLGTVRTTEGDLPAGKIVMGEGHADVNGTPRIVRAFYDATSKQVAFGRMHDDEFGPFFAGVLAPGVTAEEATTLMMSPPSGHWTNFELMAVLAVNIPGHVIPRAHVTGGQMANMVAAGQWFDEHEHPADAPGDDLAMVIADMRAFAWADEADAMAAVFQ
jgi:hypothetical protein